MVSIIILTCNCLDYTKSCVESIIRHTPEKYQFVFVDNCSSDQTIPYLQNINNAELIINKENKGFGGGCNQALSIAKGDHIVLLNNDTVVTQFWLSRMLWHLAADKTLGIIGPMSNKVISYQQLKPVPYKTIDEMHEFSKTIANSNHRQGYSVGILSGLCMVFHRSLIEAIGGFDERFYPGYYEDADFSIRAQVSGKRLWVAKDVFIHHYGSRSFSKKFHNFMEIAQHSKQVFENKWKLSNYKTISDLVEHEKPFNHERHYVPLG